MPSTRQQEATRPSEAERKPPARRTYGFSHAKVRAALEAGISKPPPEPEIVEKGKNYTVIKSKV
jgi:hypothetical protein